VSVYIDSYDCPTTSADWTWLRNHIERISSTELSCSVNGGYAYRIRLTCGIPAHQTPLKAPLMRAFVAVMACFFALLPDVAQGQLSSCTYDTCALSLDGTAILRGADRVRVGTLGLFRSTPALPLVQESSDSAITYARKFDARYNRGQTMIWTGGILSAASLAALLNRTSRNGNATTIDLVLGATTAGGLIVEFVGAFQVRRARQALSRAFWWYNRDLSR
jgi:hypothetical protein